MDPRDVAASPTVTSSYDEADLHDAARHLARDKNESPAARAVWRGIADGGPISPAAMIVLNWHVVELSLARMCIVHEGKVSPSNDRDRELVERVMHDAETLRLVATLRRQKAAERRMADRSVPAFVFGILNAPRARRRRTNFTRRTALSPGRPDEDSDPPRELLDTASAEVCSAVVSLLAHERRRRRRVAA